jgi:hypothetical protein
MPRTETLRRDTDRDTDGEAPFRKRCAAFTRDSLSSAPLIAIDIVKLMQKVGEYG